MGISFWLPVLFRTRRAGGYSATGTDGELVPNVLYDRTGLVCATCRKNEDGVLEVKETTRLDSPMPISMFVYPMTNDDYN